MSKTTRTTNCGPWFWNTELFNSKFEKLNVDECWPWQGATGPHGGLFGVNKLKHPQMTQARRIAYMEQFNTDISDHSVRMKCNNRLCVNPHHGLLEPNSRLGEWPKDVRRRISE